MPKAAYFFFWLRAHVISLNLIAFIISIETEDSLLALAKLIYILTYICSFKPSGGALKLMSEGKRFFSYQIYLVQFPQSSIC